VSSRSDDWVRIYGVLQESLLGFGRNDPLGEGDFWLVDDDWGHSQHKIELARREVATPAFIAKLQQILVGYSNGWEVILAIPRDGLEPVAYRVFSSKVVSVGLSELED